MVSPRVLFTSRSRTGSWIIRGEQLGMAVGGDVTCRAEHFRGYDLTVMVKRQRPSMLIAMRAALVPIVWDVVDAWPQPEGNQWPAEKCRQWLHDEVVDIKPQAIVAATEAMAADCAGFGLPVLTLPHHARPQMPTNPIRECVATVGYEGRDYYLGEWRPLVEEECSRRGWRFVLNPPALAEVDIVIGLRDCPGYAARKWKSNVKLANAQGAGTPCIMNRESGYVETAGSGVEWADTADELHAAFDLLSDYQARRKAGAALLASAPRLDDVAATYRTWLTQLSS